MLLVTIIIVKMGYQSCVYATAMHTELELSTPSAVSVVNRQLLTRGSINCRVIL